MTTQRPALTDADLAALLERVQVATAAYLRGDVETYFDLIRAARDGTLMPPYGGETVRWRERTAEDDAATRAFFTGGEATFELHQSYVSGDLVVLAGVERQRGDIGGLPTQDWSLRVSLVFRRTDGDPPADWEIVHRHADPLVRGISFDALAALARGS